ncbi:MAG: PASTA domain-containing protein [Chlorobiaceae bacterium]|jgi:eukaryotic-like serine/threonine-protein kinase|nr:PASTA domain-containing protein [Chlorobiaceae bacterium]NTW64667.1 PASTA domain-containing protein [Chlorobiaceae bacterium]
MKKTGFIVLGILVLLVVFDRVIMPLYISQGTTKTVPDVTGMQFEDAVNALHAAGFEAKKSYHVKYLPRVDANIVLSQMPEAGESVKPQRNVYLVLNRQDRPMFSMPDFYGRPETDVRESLDRFEMTVDGVEFNTVTNPDEDGKVVGQSIPPATMVSYGSSVSLVVGRLDLMEEVRRKAIVPDVLGMPLGQAERVIADAGLTVGLITYEYSSILASNTVISQSPAVSASVSPKQEVDLTVTSSSE